MSIWGDENRYRPRDLRLEPDRPSWPLSRRERLALWVFLAAMLAGLGLLGGTFGVSVWWVLRQIGVMP